MADLPWINSDKLSRIPENPVLVTMMETLGKTENRYSGIPTIRYVMEKQALP